MDRIKEDSPSSIGGVEPKALQRVAVIGGGLMGSGIAATMILHDLTVPLVESTEELLEQGMERTRRRLARGLASARSGLLTISEATSRIIPTTDLNTL